MRQLLDENEIFGSEFLSCADPRSSLLPAAAACNRSRPPVLLKQRCRSSVEIIRMPSSGYTTRMLHETFVARYGFLAPHDGGFACEDPLSVSLAILNRFHVHLEDNQVGYTKLFFRAGQIQVIDEERKRALQSILRIQCFFRGHITRLHLQKLKKGIITLQSVIRGEKTRRLWSKLVQEHRAVTVVQRQIRCRMDRRKFLQTRSSIIKIQSAVREWLEGRRCWGHVRPSCRLRSTWSIFALVRLSRSTYPNKILGENFPVRCKLVLDQRVPPSEMPIIVSKAIPRYEALGEVYDEGRLILLVRSEQVYTKQDVRNHALQLISEAQQYATNLSCRYQVEELQRRHASALLSSFGDNAMDLYTFLPKNPVAAMLLKTRNGKNKLDAEVIDRHNKPNCTRISALEGTSNRTDHSIVIIQSYFRGHLTRSHLKNLKTGILTLQSFVRGEVSRKLHLVMKRQHEAAVLMQRCVRRMIARKKFMEIHRATIVIQSVVRGWLARKHLKARFMINPLLIISWAICGCFQI